MSLLSSITVTEDWVPVVGYERRYEVSNKGRVRSLAQKKPRIMKKQVKGGNETVLLYDGDEYTGHTISKLVESHFGISPRIKKYVKDRKNEVWKYINRYEDLYMVSNLGRVKALNYGNKKEERLIKPQPHPKGHYQVALYKDNRHTTFMLHKLVAEHFVGGSFGRSTVIHIDGDKENNRAKNLKWATAKEAMDHAIEIGTRVMKYGAENPDSVPVYQCDKDGNILRMWDCITDAERELCKPFRVYRQNIIKVCRGERKTAGGFVWRYANKER